MPHAAQPKAQHPIPVAARRVAAPPRGSVQIADVGDMTFGLAGVEPPGGAGRSMTDVTRELRSDLTVGNLETTLGHGGSSKCSAGSTDCFSFQAPASTAVVLEATTGFDAVNVANNHSNDYGASGLAQTNAALHAAAAAVHGPPGRRRRISRGTGSGSPCSGSRRTTTTQNLARHPAGGPARHGEPRRRAPTSCASSSTQAPRVRITST